MLPQLDKPRILDIGCGSGVPTIELARLSNGEIVGLDVDQCALDSLARKLDEEGLADRIQIVKGSMFDLHFGEESFDIIWTEGSISRIGFKRGLEKWRQFLKTNGILVVHDEKGDINQKLQQVVSCGYELLKHFTISSDIWWVEYYDPWEKRVQELREEHADNPEALGLLKKEQQEIEMFKDNPERYASVFFIMRKR